MSDAWRRGIQSNLDQLTRDISEAAEAESRALDRAVRYGLQLVQPALTTGPRVAVRKAGIS